MNWAMLFAFAVAALQLGAAIGYAIRHNWRMALVWLLWALVTIILAWPGEIKH